MAMGSTIANAARRRDRDDSGKIVRTHGRSRVCAVGASRNDGSHALKRGGFRCRPEKAVPQKHRLSSLMWHWDAAGLAAASRLAATSRFTATTGSLSLRPLIDFG